MASARGLFPRLRWWRYDLDHAPDIPRPLAGPGILQVRPGPRSKLAYLSADAAAVGVPALQEDSRAAKHDLRLRAGPARMTPATYLLLALVACLVLAVVVDFGDWD